MKQEKIPFYQTNDFLILNMEGDGDHVESMEKMGFHCFKVCSPYGYQDVDVPLFEILIFYNQRTSIRVCELWDHCGCVFHFAADSELQVMEIVERYLKLVKDMCWIEKEMRKMEEE